MDNCIHWFYLCCGFLLLFGLIAVMIFRYFVKISRKGVILENNDKEQAKKHNQNCQRIEELEKKNGNEQRQINELKEEVRKLKAKYEK